MQTMTAIDRFNDLLDDKSFWRKHRRVVARIELADKQRRPRPRVVHIPCQHALNHEPANQ